MAKITEWRRVWYQVEREDDENTTKIKPIIESREEQQIKCLKCSVLAEDVEQNMQNKKYNNNVITKKHNTII
jgi:hypothetical protein